MHQRRSLRELMPSLVNTLPRCHSTVRGLINSWAAAQLATDDHRLPRQPVTGFEPHAGRPAAWRRGVPGRPVGYAQLLGWLAGFGAVCLAGVEGTGSYSAGLAWRIAAAGVRVVEAGRADRPDRRVTVRERSCGAEIPRQWLVQVQEVQGTVWWPGAGRGPG